MLKVNIEIVLGVDRVLARLSDGTVLYDDVSLVALIPSRDGHELIEQIGAQSSDVGPEAVVVRALSLEDFRPAVAAGVVAAVAMIAWGRRRSKFRGLVAALDRVNVFVEIEKSETLTPEDRRQFAEELPYHPQISWWIGGERLTH